MVVLIAFLAGFYFGVFAVSLMVVAGRRKDAKKEKMEIHLIEQPQVQQMILF